MESILVWERVDEEVGQDASETPEASSPRSCSLSEEVAANMESWARVCLASAKSTRPAGERRKKASRESFIGVPSNTKASFMHDIWLWGEKLAFIFNG